MYIVYPCVPVYNFIISSCLLPSPSILSTYHLPWHTFIVWSNNEVSRLVSAAPKFVSKDLRQWIFQLSQKIWQPSVPGERSAMRRLAYFHPGEAPRAPLLSPFDYFAFLFPAGAYKTHERNLFICHISKSRHFPTMNYGAFPRLVCH